MRSHLRRRGLLRRAPRLAIVGAVVLAAAMLPVAIARGAPASTSIPVSVFNYPGLNGAPGGLDCGTENSNLISIVDALDGYEVDGSIVSFGGDAWAGGATVPRPDGYTVDTFASLLDASRFFFMTDMEAGNPSDTNFLPVAARDALASWVDAGGVMVMTGTYGTNDTTFLNLVFGWDLTTASGSSWSKDPAGTSGTPFDPLAVPSLPNLSATDAIGAGTVPGFTAMWGTSNNATVATIPHGRGTVIYLGYDFYNTGAASPAGGRSGPACGQYGSDWVQQVLPAALAYAAALSDTTVADLTPTSASFTYSFSRAGTFHYLLLPAGAPAPTTEEMRTGTYAGATAAASGSAELAANEAVTIPLTGLAPTRAYKLYAFTRYTNPDNAAEQLDSGLRVVEFTTFAPAPGVTATAGDGKISVAVTMDPAATITNYEYSLDGGATWLTLAPASTASPIVIDGLTNGTAYDVVVRALSAAGAGVPSATMTVTPAVPPPVVPPTQATPAPVPETSGRLPDLRPGQAGSTIGGAPADVRVEPVSRDGGLTGIAVDGGSFAIELDPSDAAGAGSGTGAVAGDSLLLTAGEGVRVRMSGFRANAPVAVWLFSEPQLLGEFTTDVGGGLDAALALLPADLSACQHTIQVVGSLPDGREAAASLGVWLQSVPYPFSDLSFEAAHGREVGCLHSLGIAQGYGDGRYLPGASVSRGQVSSLIARSLGLEGAAPSFIDAASSVHARWIGAVEAVGITGGFDDGTFRPDAPVTRGQLATFLARAAGLDLGAVPADAVDAADGLHGRAVAALREVGIVHGYDDGTFRAGESIRRDHVASLLSRLLDHRERAS